MRPTAALLSIALVLGAACEREPPPEGEPVEAPPPVEVTGVRVVSEDEGPEPFTPDDRISAVVHTRGVAESATLVAVWRDAEGRVVTESSRSITPRGPQTTPFPVSRPAGWPPGTYRVEVWLDGRRAGSRSFTVAGEGATAPRDGSSPDG